MTVTSRMILTIQHLTREGVEYTSLPCSFCLRGTALSFTCILAVKKGKGNMMWSSHLCVLYQDVQVITFLMLQFQAGIFILWLPLLLMSLILLVFTFALSFHALLNEVLAFKILIISYLCKILKMPVKKTCPVSSNCLLIQSCGCHYAFMHIVL